MNTPFLSDPRAADLVQKVGKAIISCGFMVIVSRYLNDNNAPWILTVGGDQTLHRRIVIKSISADGTDAELAILDEDQSKKRISQLDLTKIEYETTLKKLVSMGPESVRVNLATPCLETEPQ